MDKTKIDDYAVLEIKDTNTTWHFDKATGLFILDEVTATRSYVGTNYPTEKRDKEFLFIKNFFLV